MINFTFKNTFSFMVAVLVVILAIHAWAVATAGYYHIWWLDMVLHLTGGFWVGLFFIWVFYAFGRVKIPAASALVLLLLISSFGVFVGVLWEFFEFIFDRLVLQKTNMLPAQLSLQDTMSDLFLDWMGAMLAGILFLLSDSWKSKNT